MDESVSPVLRKLFRFVVGRRFLVLACFALIAPVAVVRALRVESDPSIARLIVGTDPDFRANQEFQALFPEGEQVVLLLDAPDPFAPQALARLEDVERRLQAVPRVRTISALALYERMRPGARGSPDWADDFRRFAS